MKRLTLIALALLTTTTFAQTQRVDKVRVCLERANLTPLKILSKVSMPKRDLDMALFTACDELDDPTKNESAGFAQIDPIYDQGVSVVSSVIAGFYKEGIAALAENLTGSPAQREYRAHLEMIKRIKDPHERLIRTWNLAKSHQGEYGPIVNLLRNPGQIIDAAAEGKRGGICREFALLLAFSLRWVARPYGVEAPQFGGLGPYAFNATIRYSMRHAWVRVNMDKFENGKRVGLQTFDLDTTWHDVFAPLNPRRTGEERWEIAEKSRRCLKAIECVNKVNSSH
ncbi:MAG: hypothetical protein K2P81_07400 [Bacteriovoracaceae bacterium]|nr:hypothetical protein [Bacteriovoracaceae bacterium]